MEDQYTSWQSCLITDFNNDSDEDLDGDLQENEDMRELDDADEDGEEDLQENQDKSANDENPVNNEDNTVTTSESLIQLAQTLSHQSRYPDYSSMLVNFMVLNL